MKKLILLKAATAMVIAFTSVGAIASTTYTVINHTPYSVEISGLVNATPSVDPITVANGKSSIYANGNFIGHLMVIQPGKAGYVDNIVLENKAGDFEAFDLYKAVHIARAGDTVTLS